MMLRGDFIDEELKRYMALSAKEKLDFLEEMNQFFSKVIPDENKKIWSQLQKEGW